MYYSLSLLVRVHDTAIHQLLDKIGGSESRKLICYNLLMDADLQKKLDEINAKFVIKNKKLLFKK